MVLIFEQEAEAGFDFDPKPLAEKVIETVLDCEDFPYEAEVSVLLTDDETIRQINAAERNIDAATDVLSFPMLDCTDPWKDAPLEEERLPVDYDNEAVLLGDIVLNVARIHSQAEEYGHSLKREYAFLIVHSMLHLLGYDHMEEEERLRMEERQRVILDILSIPRE